LVEATNYRQTQVEQDRKEKAAMTTQTATANTSKQDLAVEQKIQELRKLYADTPQFAKTALENTLKDLTSVASQPRSRMESAGRTGSRQGTVSELTVIAPFAPGGAARLRALLAERQL
jgi:predicted  nucleic acid-binding Zn-ribbon protein